MTIDKFNRMLSVPTKYATAKNQSLSNSPSKHMIAARKGVANESSMNDVSRLFNINV